MPSGGHSRTRNLIDDDTFFRLVELLARLSLVDFIAVVQAARYRRQFEERIPHQCAGERAGS